MTTVPYLTGRGELLITEVYTKERYVQEYILRNGMTTNPSVAVNIAIREWEAIRSNIAYDS